MKTKVDHFGIYADDEDKLAEWYKKKLGFKERVRMDKAKGSVYFLEPDAGSEVEILPSLEEGDERAEFRTPGSQHVCLLVDDFEETKAELESKDLSVYGISDLPQGWKIGYVDDPEGNIVEIMEGKDQIGSLVWNGKKDEWELEVNPTIRDKIEKREG